MNKFVRVRESRQSADKTLTLFRRIFWTGLCLHCVLWWLAPSLLMSGYRYDVLFLYSLGREWTAVSYQHPNLPAWILQTLNLLTGYTYGMPFLASQLLILLAVFSVWRLGKSLMPEQTALPGALVFCLFFYCNYRSIEYNHPLVAMSFWAVAVSFLHSAFQRNRLRDWFITGAALGLGLNSYYMQFNLCFAILVFMTINKNVRKYWCTPGPYVSLLTAVCLFLPQVFSMLHSHQITSFHYVTSSISNSLPARAWNSLNFIFMQMLVLLPLLFALLPFTGIRLQIRKLETEERFDSHFLLFFTFFPLACLSTLSLLTGIPLEARFGSSMWAFAGLLFLYHIQNRITEKSFVRSILRIGVIDLLILGFVLGRSLFAPLFIEPSERFHSVKEYPHVAVGSFRLDYSCDKAYFPIKKLGRFAQESWNRHCSEPCPFVGGEPTLAIYAAIGMKDHPLVVRPHLHSDEDINRHGGLILWRSDNNREAEKEMQLRFPKMRVLPTAVLQYHTFFNKLHFEVHAAVVLPSDSQ